jgi:hypothetical protein
VVQESVGEIQGEVLADHDAECVHPRHGLGAGGPRVVGRRTARPYRHICAIQRRAEFGGLESSAGCVPGWVSGLGFRRDEALGCGLARKEQHWQQEP